MTVAGVMSGTSADGIDVAVVRIAPGKLRPTLRLLAHEGFAFHRGIAERGPRRHECAVNFRLRSSRGSTGGLGLHMRKL